jgi:hypothetical protein
MTSRLILLLLACALAVFGQATPSSVTVTATRTANLAPDQIIFAVNVDSPVTATREDVISAIDGAGITAANFSAVRTTQIYDQTGRQASMALEWTFLLPVPLSAIKSTIGLLTAVQANLAGKNSGIAMAFSVQGTQVSQQAQQLQTCSLPDLLGDARSQAQKLAGAAGATVGSILAVTSATVVSPGNQWFASASSLSPACTITVKFALTGVF